MDMQDIIVTPLPAPDPRHPCHDRHCDEAASFFSRNEGSMLGLFSCYVHVGEHAGLLARAERNTRLGVTVG